jgi:hypothetical protein
VNFKLGRLPRAYDQRVPLMSALTAGAPPLPPPPAAVDYTFGMPADLGMMLNDQQGCCTCAAWGHAKQVWSFNGNPPMQTPSDADIETLYEAFGYDPSQTDANGNNPTDQGAVEQDVLAYLMNTGAAGDRLAAYVEIDPANLDNVKRAIADGGIAYIGFNVPNYLMAGSEPPAVWDVDPSADNGIAGGHAVILAGYDANDAKVISWGKVYTMTWAFFSAFTDEVYALADKSWFTLAGMSVAGLTLAQLEAAMQALKEAA